MITTSDGKAYEDEYDLTLDRPIMPSGVTQKAVDDLVKVAPDFASNPVIDQMQATAERSRISPMPSDLASADPIANKKGQGSDMEGPYPPKKSQQPTAAEQAEVQKKINEMIKNQRLENKRYEKEYRAKTPDLARDPIEERQRDPYAEDIRRTGGYWHRGDVAAQVAAEALLAEKNFKDNIDTGLVKTTNTPVKMPGDISEATRNKILKQDLWKQIIDDDILRDNPRNPKDKKSMKNRS